jgi:hypothetical protein
MRHSLPGNSCGGIPNISATTGRLLTRNSAQTTEPKRRPAFGDYDFAIDPELRSDQALLAWLPHLDPATIVLAPAPEFFSTARHVGLFVPTFERHASDGDYWCLHDAEGRLTAVMIGRANAATPAAVVIPLDQDFASRAEAALHLWRRLSGRSRGRRTARLSPQRRDRLVLALRALDAHLVGETYRVIAQVLFGRAGLPMGGSWKTHDLRDRTIRLVRTGLDLMRGGYLDLLRSPGRRRS